MVQRLRKDLSARTHTSLMAMGPGRVLHARNSSLISSGNTVVLSISLGLEGRGKVECGCGP